ncbi:hypothetical protein HanLR1_Chr14g0527561 [Helianthus annuus]|nr:hypothetical protein HanHA89_Chr14g0565221 [Helianthus annuus]KAJ0655723.1 hypothetical protein HanLR1_Chr14g0527561 [Helianthus annuus]
MIRIIPRCENKRTTYKSMKFSRFKKLGLGFDILFEGLDTG